MSRVPPRSVTVRAPAKVNLELRVGPLRPDGYHSLATVYLAVGIHDDVTVTRADEWRVTAQGANAELVPLDETNLAVRAAKAVGARIGVDDPLAIHIRKEIPVAGGMAGGSADAAAALVAANAIWEGGLDRESLLDLAARLGSDVPFPVMGGIALGSGRGERLTSVLARGTYHWVFALSEDGMSTPQVYDECDRLRELSGEVVPEPTPNPDLLAALRTGDAVSLGAALVNDLQPAAFSLRPELEQIVEIGQQYDALGAIVSGSGPTVALLAPDPTTAINLCVVLGAAGVATSVKRTVGPAHGAHIVPALAT